MMRYIATIGLAILAALARLATAQEAVAESIGSVTTRKGALSLDVQGAANDSVKRVAVRLESDEAPGVSGTADVIGFPFIKSASLSDIDWKVDGSNVTGSITGRDGHVVGTFEGTITAAGMTGEFRHVDGRVGQWSWDGPPPQ